MNEVLSEVKICAIEEKKQYGTPMLRPLSWSRAQPAQQSRAVNRLTGVQALFSFADNFYNPRANRTVEKLEKSYVNSAAPSNK